jgi:hypothetical protein
LFLNLYTNRKANKMAEKRVGFRDIEILEFPYILGDNPAVSAGAPIALGHDLEGKITMELDT